MSLIRSSRSIVDTSSIDHHDGVIIYSKSLVQELAEMVDKLARAISISSRTMPMLLPLTGVGKERSSQLVEREPHNNHYHNNVLITPPPASKTLLLEGDEFYVSKDGISRTFYELKSWARGSREYVESHPISLEERYDLKRANKTFIIRGGNGAEDSSKSSRNVAVLGSPLGMFELQEIDGGVLGTAGTGATTWESSIAMSLFFSSNAHLLRGDVIELGSGVGLAGLLGQIIPTMHSLTLTDGNDEVLEQCRRNLDQVRFSGLLTRVQKLDWYDFINKKSTVDSMKRYDTVLVSDCCYRYSDVDALANAMTLMCRHDSQSRIHVFGPNNRGALLELVGRLKDGANMHVDTDWIEMTRYRLKPATNALRTNDFLSDDECPFVSKNTAKFLHVTASHEDGAINEFNTFTDID